MTVRRAEGGLRRAGRGRHPSRSTVDAVRVAWIVAVVLLVVGLAALTTTCTGPRPRPTGETLPADVTAGGSGVTTPTTAATLPPDGPG